MQQLDLTTLRSAARARGFEIDLSNGLVELFLLSDPNTAFTTSWPTSDERAEREAREWLEHYCPR